MKTILTTGGAGYIASHTNVVLLEAGYDVVAVDNFSNSDISAVKSVEKITGKSVKFYEGDVADKALMTRVFEENDIYAVIHFAGLKAVGESCAKPLLYYRNNLDTTLTLLEVMAEKGCKNFVFSSSATVYGTPERLPIDEDCRLSVTNPYGATKLMIEDILRDASKADPSMHTVLLRYFNPVGAHESGLIGEDPKGIPNNLMPYVAKVAAGILPTVNVFGNDYPTPDGTGVRDYIHVMDLAYGHLAALNHIEEYACEAINLGTGTGYSVLDMIKAFSKACGKEIPFVVAPRRAGDIASCYASPDKAEKELGWKTHHNLDDMCRDLWNFQQKRMQG
jgi:UDP-glucose 4-epimerase